MKIYISFTDFILVIMWFVIFRFSTSYTSVYYGFQIFASIILFAGLSRYVRKIKIMPWICLYALIIILSSIINRSEIGIVHTIRGCALALEIIDVFLVIYYYVLKKGFKELCSHLLILSGIFFYINFIQILMASYSNTINDRIFYETFFSGGKFAVAYQCIIYIMLLLYWLEDKIRKNSIISLAHIFINVIFAFYICWTIECSTGIVALAILIIMVFMPEKIWEILKNRKVIFAVLILMGSMVSLIGVILSFGVVQDILINVLHENISLTGRTELYALLIPKLIEAGVFGNGFGSYATSTLGYHGWYNAQNGLAEIVLTYGYFGVIAFCVLVYSCLYDRKKIDIPIFAACYAFLFISAVEIPYGPIFILLLSLIYFGNNECYK